MFVSSVRPSAVCVRAFDARTETATQAGDERGKATTTCALHLYDLRKQKWEFMSFNNGEPERNNFSSVEP